MQVDNSRGERELNKSESAKDEQGRSGEILLETSETDGVIGTNGKRTGMHV